MKVTITDHIQDYILEKNDKIDVALEEIGLVAEGHAKVHLEKAPRRIDTGRLRNSVTHMVGNYSDAEGTFGSRSVVVGTNVEYGKYVELGTSKMAPNNFLRSAAGDHGTEYRSIIIEHLKK